MAASTVNRVSLVSSDTWGEFCAQPDLASVIAKLKAKASRKDRRLILRIFLRNSLRNLGIDGWTRSSVRTGQFAVKREWASWAGQVVAKPETRIASSVSPARYVCHRCKAPYR